MVLGLLVRGAAPPRICLDPADAGHDRRYYFDTASAYCRPLLEAVVLCPSDSRTGNLARRGIQATLSGPSRIDHSSLCLAMAWAGGPLKHLLLEWGTRVICLACRVPHVSQRHGINHPQSTSRLASRGPAQAAANRGPRGQVFLGGVI